MRLLSVLLVAAALALTLALGTYFLSPPLFLRGAVGLERWTAGLHAESTQIPGFRIAYLDSGGAGAPLVLVHGFGGDKDNWVRVARSLRGPMRVIALDLPGYGESDAPADAAYSIAAQVEHLHAFLAQIGLTRAHLGGHSMGGNIVASYAAKYPNQVASLWLVAPSGVERAPTSELRLRIEQTGQNALIPRSAAEYREMIDWVMTQPPLMPQRLLAVMADRAVAASTLRTRQFEQLMQESHHLEGLIDGLPIPTHILWGERDRSLHVGGADVLAGLIPGATRTLLPGIGHVPQLEDPDTTAQDYLAFRERRGP